MLPLLQTLENLPAQVALAAAFRIIVNGE
eukprot:COSAG02_NODE_7033_length_3217_cov_9.411339_4_plen_28_part_01